MGATTSRYTSAEVVYLMSRPNSGSTSPAFMPYPQTTPSDAHPMAVIKAKIIPSVTLTLASSEGVQPMMIIPIIYQKHFIIPQMMTIHPFQGINGYFCPLSDCITVIRYHGFMMTMKYTLSLMRIKI